MRIFQTRTARKLKPIPIKPIEDVGQKERKEHLSLLFSLLAVLVSLAAIYFQFFYEKFEMSVSIIDTEVKEDSLKLSLIYNNKGNQDATVIRSEIFFFSGKNIDDKHKRLYFIQKVGDPYILPPNKQIFRIQSVRASFQDINLSEFDLSKTDTIKIGLDVQFLNDNTLQAEVLTECGWLTINENKMIDLYWVNYMKIPLDADSYFSSGYSTKIKEKASQAPPLNKGWLDTVLPPRVGTE